MAKKVTNRMYQLYELRDSLKEAVKNLTTVKTQQKHLVQIVTSSKYKEELGEFAKGVTEDCKGYENKIKSYEERLALADGLIKLYEARDEKSVLVAKVVTELLEAMNLIVDEPSVEA